MRFQMFKCEITRDGRNVSGALVATDQEHASEIVGNDLDLAHESSSFNLQRVDHNLPADKQLGLNALLDGAPAGFVSFFDGVGWISHAQLTPKLRFYLIESADGADAQIVAPNADVAAAIWLSSLDLGDDGTHPMWRITPGLGCLDDRQRTEIEEWLEFGPVGIVHWNIESGWSLD